MNFQHLRVIAALVVFLAYFFPGPGIAEVYECQEEQGRIVFTDTTAQLRLCKPFFLKEEQENPLHGSLQRLPNAGRDSLSDYAPSSVADSGRNPTGGYAKSFYASKHASLSPKRPPGVAAPEVASMPMALNDLQSSHLQEYRPDPLGTPENTEVVSDRWETDLEGNRVSYSVQVKGKEVLALEYQRGEDGRIIAKSETIEGRTSTIAYEYDRHGWLQAVIYNGNELERFIYDEHGNRLSRIDQNKMITATYDDAHRLIQYGLLTFTHDRYGNISRRITQGQPIVYNYDQGGHLQAVQLGDNQQVTYTLDDAHRRVKTVVTTDDLEHTEYFAYDTKSRLIIVMNGEGAPVNTFVYRPQASIPDFIIRERMTYRIIRDLQNSPRLVINSVTGEIVQRIDYDTFGRILQDTNPGFQPFGFAGGLYDSTTGLIFYKDGSYDPSLGRWLTPRTQPMGIESISPYVFSNNDPVNLHPLLR